MDMSMKTLLRVLNKMFAQNIRRADFKMERLHGGTLGDVQHITGMAEADDGKKIPYGVVRKVQKKWERHGDPGSWRREYDLYVSPLGALFTDSLRWPACYLAEINEEETEVTLWMEYMDGVSGLGLTGEMLERAAGELGRFQGRLYAQRPSFLQDLPNLSQVDYAKNFYWHYRSWPVVHDYIRSDACELPGHLRGMLIDADENADALFGRIEKLPVVFCHRDFWVANIFYADGKIALIDWDTAGWGYMGEDIASLIADEADVEHMVEYYQRCVPAYYRGFSQYADAPPILDNCVRELIIILFGYRLIEWYLSAQSPDEKKLHENTLQKIYEMRAVGGNGHC